jgi:hypothetical protein
VTKDNLAPETQLPVLIRINTRDMLESFGLENVRWGRRLLELACYYPARRFALTILEFDRRVAHDGLHRAATWGMQQFAADVTVTGAGNIPQQGPVLFLANHPGITDTLALFTALARPDLLVIAAVRPFLQSLDNVTRRLLYVDQNAGSNFGVVRSAANHLRRGGAILTFPAGKIEPDPAVLPGAPAALEHWSESIDLFARLAPETLVVPVLVSGVFARRALASPLVRLRRCQADRERFAAMLQVVAPQRYPVHVQVSVGPPITAAPRGDAQSGALKQAVVEQMRSLLHQQLPEAPARHGQ